MTMQSELDKWLRSEEHTLYLHDALPI